MPLGDWCAAGEPNMIRLSPEQFKPINPKLGADAKTMYATCVLCNQRTIVKQSPPRSGFFIRHKSTQQGYRSASDNRPGTPPRVQGRG